MATAAIHRLADLSLSKLPKGETRDFSSRLTVQGSLDLLQSLRQSRETWLTSAFTKLSAYQARSNHTHIWSVTEIGTCDLEIGPHVFLETSFSAVSLGPGDATIHPSPVTSACYRSNHPLPSSSSLHISPSHSTPHVSGILPQAHNRQPPAFPSTNQAAYDHPIPGLQSHTSPLVQTAVPGSSPGSNYESSAQLIASIESASAYDLELQRLLSVAADGSATEEELTRLTLHIQGICTQVAKVSSPRRLDPATAHTSSAGEKAPALEIILAFTENSSESFVLPLRNSIVEQRIVLASTDSCTGCSPRTCDIIISTVMPFDLDLSVTNHVCRPVTLKLSGAPPSLWLAISERIQADNQEQHQLRTEITGKAITNSLTGVDPRTSVQKNLRGNADITVLEPAVGQILLLHAYSNALYSDFRRTQIQESPSPPRVSLRNDTTPEITPAMQKPAGSSHASPSQFKADLPLPTSSSNPVEQIHSRPRPRFPEGRKYFPTPGLVVEVVVPSLRSLSSTRERHARLS